MMKCDPCINVDPDTTSPYQHARICGSVIAKERHRDYADRRGRLRALLLRLERVRGAAHPGRG